MSATQQSLPSTSASLSSIPELKHSNYVRCDLCRLKFPKTDIGDMEQQAHRGTRECHHRQAEKTNKKSSFQASAVTSRSNAVYPSKYEYPALFSSGSWSRKCDLCEETINLGENLQGGSFNMHRNSKVCRKGQRLLNSRNRYQTADEQLEKPRGLLKFFKRMSSQASLDGSKAPSSKGSSKLEVESLSIPRVPVKKTHNMKSPTGDRGVRPADADRRTLAHDIRRALKARPAGSKRKNGEDDKNVQKKPRGTHCETDLGTHW